MIKALAFISLFGYLIFGLLLITFIVLIVAQPHIIISHEYARSIMLYILPIAIFIGLSMLFGCINFINLYNKQEKKKRVARLFLFIFGSVIFALLMGWLSYVQLQYIPATLLHDNSLKEHITIEVSATSVSLSKYNFICEAHMNFNKPDISPTYQYICISFSQWQYYREVNFPKYVNLCGEKSFFGYKLNSCEE